MAKLEVNLDLITKYNVPGPRYTSYPTAPHFTEAVSWSSVRDLIQDNNQTPRELSLYFHLPFCRNLCWFCGCTAVITKDSSQGTRYIDFLEKEIGRIIPMLHPERRVGQLHLGGGTPTFLLPDDLRKLGALIHRHFRLDDHAESGVEIDPRGTTLDHLAALREAGFNRASIGIQDHDPQVQKAVHRIQPREMNQEVVSWVRQAGFTSVNIDLIYGLPFQTVASFDRTLDEVLELSPDRFAIFNYAHVPWMKRSQRVFKVLPTPENKLGLLKLSIEKLTSCGYVYIGMDHFARETDELAIAQSNKTLQRNFQGYSTHADSDIYAFGMSSISQTDRVYWQNHKELPLYYQSLALGESPMAKGYVLTVDDQIRRKTIMQLMCNLDLDYTRMSDLLNINFVQYFAPELASLDDLEADGLLQRSASRLRITDVGRLLIRNIAMRFDAFLKKENDRRFSKTI